MSEKKKATVEPAAEPRYTVAALRDSCMSALGLEQSTFDGVFYGVPDGATYTIAEAQARADKWLKKPLKLI